MKNIIGILKYIKGYWGYATLNIVSNVLSALFSLFSFTMVFPFLQILFADNKAKWQEVIDKGQPSFSLSTESIFGNINYLLAKDIQDNGHIHTLVAICVFLITTIFFKNLFRYLALYFISPIRNGVIKDLRNQIFKKILILPLSYYSEEKKGDIMSRMTTDVKEIEWSILTSLEMLFREPITIMLFFTFMVLLNWQLTIIAFVLLPLAGVLIARIGKSLKQTSAEEKEKSGQIMSILDETLDGLRIIKGFNAERFINAKFSNVNEDYTSLMTKAYRKVDLSSPLSEFMGVSVFSVILYFGGTMVLGDDSSMIGGAAFITYLIYFSQLISPAKSFTTAFYNAQRGLASAERINMILDADETIKDAESPKELRAFESEVKFNEVCFAYKKGEIGWVLNNINLTIPKGKTIALVGQSGSGKTTMANMLPRFYDPSSGNITIDGINIKDVKLKDVRNLLGIVTQESILFNDSVYNNIAFGIDDVTKEEVIEAAKVANAHNFIMGLTDGYETNIGDRGGKLSGGQKQRVSIARAILKNPPILLLDEATSALDTESERLVQDALNNLMKNRTSLVIAHRLSTIQHADEIIVLDKGEIIERGTHTELLSHDGIYKKLHSMQMFQ